MSRREGPDEQVCEEIERTTREIMDFWKRNSGRNE
jgi:hypothetical protein